MAGISQAVYSLAGVLIGGGITTTVAVWTQRTQLRNTIAAESRNREIGASATAITALGRLRARPAGEDDDEALLALATAAQDLRDAGLRARLAEAGRILTEHAAAFNMAGQEEPVSRKIACEHGIECLGAFRRGEPIPPTPEPFAATLAAIDRWTLPRT